MILALQAIAVALIIGLAALWLYRIVCLIERIEKLEAERDAEV